MRTSKPISSISYNSPLFLSDLLNRLLSAGLISFFAWIQHEPEKDERKSHIHLYVEPAKMLDTLVFSKYFDELDPTNGKPLSVMPWQSSKYYDWYMYGLHDTKYLLARNMVRDYHYNKSDMFFSDIDYSDNKIVESVPQGKDVLFNFLTALDTGLTWHELVFQGYVPLGNYIALRKVYDDFSKRSSDSRYFDNSDISTNLVRDKLLSAFGSLVNEPSPFDK